MFKKSLALSILGLFVPQSGIPVTQDLPKQQGRVKGGKGQLRHTSKPSGAAALKRAAKKRNNIRKHKS